jgi:hypothetical protein
MSVEEVRHHPGQGAAGGKLIVSQQRVQIDRSFSVKTLPKDRFQLCDSSGEVGVQSLGLGLTGRGLLKFALSLGRFL